MKISISGQDKAIARINDICIMINRLQKKHMWDIYSTIYNETREHTMMATGETRSKLFLKRANKGSHFVSFSCGYHPTSNNQSISQELNLDKPVHRSIHEHLTDAGFPKCSRRPIDLFKRVGMYKVNPVAERGALRNSIARNFKVPVHDPVIDPEGFRYEPSLSAIVGDLTVIASGVTRHYA
jgi:hypothetical protein